MEEISCYGVARTKIMGIKEGGEQVEKEKEREGVSWFMGKRGNHITTPITFCMLGLWMAIPAPFPIGSVLCTQDPWSLEEL